MSNSNSSIGTTLNKKYFYTAPCTGLRRNSIVYIGTPCTVYYSCFCLTFDTGIHRQRDVGMQILNKDRHLTHYLQTLAT